MNKKLKAFERLLNIMDELRSQCPWDKKQTMESLRHLTIEETYELTDAILTHDYQEVKKELGDLMMHLVFYAKIASEERHFDIADVLNSICEKLIHRHPHIYGDAIVKDEDDVKKNWEQLKLKEGNKSVLSGVPKSLPALIKAHRIQEKAHGVGFDFDNADDAWLKVKEEIEEFEQASLNISEKEAEFGDLLFALINYARFMNINSEDALEKTNQKFIRRFTFIENSAQENKKAIHELSLSEMDTLWNLAKKEGL